MKAIRHKFSEKSNLKAYYNYFYTHREKQPETENNSNSERSSDTPESDDNMNISSNLNKKRDTYPLPESSSAKYSSAIGNNALQDDGAVGYVELNENKNDANLEYPQPVKPEEIIADISPYSEEEIIAGISSLYKGKMPAPDFAFPDKDKAQVSNAIESKPSIDTGTTSMPDAQAKSGCKTDDKIKADNAGDTGNTINKPEPVNVSDNADIACNIKAENSSDMDNDVNKNNVPHITSKANTTVSTDTSNEGNSSKPDDNVNYKLTDNSFVTSERGNTERRLRRQKASDTEDAESKLKPVQKKIEKIYFKMNSEGCFINGKPFDPANPPYGILISVDQKTAKSEKKR